jgi:hypothetical protein
MSRIHAEENSREEREGREEYGNNPASDLKIWSPFRDLVSELKTLGFFAPFA